MGQKVNPIGIRLGITRDWNSVWYAEKGNFAKNLLSDARIRDYLMKKFKQASLSRVSISRPPQLIKITLHTARPGMIIGKKGEGIEKLAAEVTNYLSFPVVIDVQEIRLPDLDAQLVANSIAFQLEKRVMFRRAMKKSTQMTMKAGAQGIKVSLSGRIGGAEIARCEWSKQGNVPLHVFRKDIDYAVAEAHTTFGIIGVKIWINKGDIKRGQSNVTA